MTFLCKNLELKSVHCKSIFVSGSPSHGSYIRRLTKVCFACVKLETKSVLTTMVQMLTFT